LCQHAAEAFAKLREKLYNHIALNLSASENKIGQYNRIADEILKLDFFPERFKIIDLQLDCIKENAS